MIALLLAAGIVGGHAVQTQKVRAAEVIDQASGTGSVARSQHAINSDTVSVKDFGATGDGTTDDTAAVNAAVAAAGNIGNVFFPCPGSYRTTNRGTLSCSKASVIAPGNRVVFLGDSIEIRGGSDTQWEQLAWPSHFLVRANAQVYMLHNAGVSGNTTAQMLARFATDVAAYRPDKVFIKGGTNDVGNSVPFATSIANIASLAQYTLDIGAVPILCTIPPRSDGYHAAIEQLNAGIKAYARSHGLTVVDFYAALVDTANGNYIAAYNGDNVHPSAIGARVMADTAITATAGLWQKWNPYQPQENTDPNNWIANGLMLTAGTAGKAASWTQFGSSSATFALVADAAILGQWQQITKVDVGNNVVFDQVFNAAGHFSVGDRIALTCRVKTSGVDAGGGQYKLYLDYGNGNLVYPVGSLWTVDTNGTFYIESIVPAATTSATFYVVVQGNTITLSFAQCGLINVTTLGLSSL